MWCAEDESPEQDGECAKWARNGGETRGNVGTGTGTEGSGRGPFWILDWGFWIGRGGSRPGEEAGLVVAVGSAYPTHIRTNLESKFRLSAGVLTMPQNHASLSRPARGANHPSQPRRNLDPQRRRRKDVAAMARAQGPPGIESRPVFWGAFWAPCDLLGVYVTPGRLLGA